MVSVSSLTVHLLVQAASTEDWTLFSFVRSETAQDSSGQNTVNLAYGKESSGVSFSSGPREEECVVQICLSLHRNE